MNPFPAGGTRHECPAQAQGTRSAFVRPLGVVIVAHCDMRYIIFSGKIFPESRAGYGSWRSTTCWFRRWRLTADTTASNEAVVMLGSRPTPHITVPSPRWVST